jgi:hypothetical protein
MTSSFETQFAQGHSDDTNVTVVLFIDQTTQVAIVLKLRVSTTHGDITGIIKVIVLVESFISKVQVFTNVQDIKLKLQVLKVNQVL